MGINHREPAYTDKAAPLIEEFGGKMGGLKFIVAYVDALRDKVLPMFTLKPGEELGDQYFPGANILRGSHPHDFQGLVDILETKTVAYPRPDDLSDAAFSIQRAAQSEAVMRYAQYENPLYDGKITVGIQPYNDGQRGSVVEHPNQPGQYLVTRIFQWGGMEMPSVGMYAATGTLLHDCNARPEARKQEESVVDFYKILQR